MRPVVQPLFAATGLGRPASARPASRSPARASGTRSTTYRDADATASIDGVDLGAPAACPAAGFGFSEFPAQPAIVRVTSMFAEATAATGGG